MGEYLIFVMNAVNGVHLNLCVKKFKKNEKITVLGSVYIAAVNVLFYIIKCAILHRYQCVIFHLVFDFTLGVYFYICGVNIYVKLYIICVV